MIAGLVLWGGLAQAQPPEPLIAELPAPAAAFMGCHSLMAAGSWFSGDDLGLDGLDQLSRVIADPDEATRMGLSPEGPLLAATTANGDHVIAVLPLADQARFRAEFLPLLIQDTTPAPDAPDTWIDEAGDPMTLTFGPDVATLRVGAFGPPAAQSDVLPGLARRVDPGLGGCWVAGDVLAMGAAQAEELGAEAVLIQGSAVGDRFRVDLIGVPLEDQVGGALTGLTPARRTHGRSVAAPDIAVRVNGDPIEALTSAQQLSMLLGRGLPPIVGSGGSLLEESGLEIQPGVEMALTGLFTAPEPSATLVLPVSRPRTRRGLDRELDRAFEGRGLTPLAVGRARSLDGVGGMEGWWIGATRGAVVLATEPEAVEALVTGVGETWIPASQAKQAAVPGIWVRADLAGVPMLALPLIVTAHVGAPAPGEVALVLDAPGLMDALTDQLPGLVEDRTGASEGPTGSGPQDDPVGNPRSTEALSVLMLIASRQEATLAEQGNYVAYDGGPRAVDQLDASEVAWDGIPAIGLDPMDAACRYEVRVDHEGWLATAWCDQDADGEPAVLLLRPGGTPITVSPPGVR